MKRVLLALLGIPVIAGFCMAQAGTFNQQGMASQEMLVEGLNAAHPSLPIGSRAMVTNAITGDEIEVTIVGRIPPSPDRIIDLSPSAALALNISDGGFVLVIVPGRPLPIPVPPETFLESLQYLRYGEVIYLDLTVEPAPPEPVHVAEPPMLIPPPLPPPVPVEREPVIVTVDPGSVAREAAFAAREAAFAAREAAIAAREAILVAREAALSELVDELYELAAGLDAREVTLSTLARDLFYEAAEMAARAAYERRDR